MALKLRFSGEEHDIRQALGALRDAPGIRLVDTSGAQPNRRDGGVRVYAVVEIRATQRAEETTPTTATAIESGPVPEIPDV
ncbi:hypothetical protein [Streptomonospora litoralis]|uniref:Uncharacterized protein n=1 Tax=Streptomonospora litoralis TaxID=2498135 RepID=A0A4P6PYT1_9ACTN|nr:hypothetical protein [Streptomonospora litoralis]QBI53398.1 hypothetical protein EKD16_08020 [Streptomonospora litoralis]